MVEKEEEEEPGKLSTGSGSRTHYENCEMSSDGDC